MFWTPESRALYYLESRKLEAMGRVCPECGEPLTYAPTFGDYYCKNGDFNLSGPPIQGFLETAPEVRYEEAPEEFTIGTLVYRLVRK